ncbi:GDSL-like lipase/Acylhydrolase domain-containing protein [Sarocladium implicatum]|nr:GDSL-like lipase/Acylhydrolase domain-containing protein [Sarocladium implicatum]
MLNADGGGGISSLPAEAPVADTRALPPLPPSATEPSVSYNCQGNGISPDSELAWDEWLDAEYAPWTRSHQAQGPKRAEESSDDGEDGSIEEPVRSTDPTASSDSQPLDATYGFAPYVWESVPAPADGAQSGYSGADSPYSLDYPPIPPPAIVEGILSLAAGLPDSSAPLASDSPEASNSTDSLSPISDVGNSPGTKGPGVILCRRAFQTKLRAKYIFLGFHDDDWPKARDIVAAYFWVVIMQARANRREDPVRMHHTSKLYLSTTAPLYDALGEVRPLANETLFITTTAEVSSLTCLCQETPNAIPGLVDQDRLVQLAKKVRVSRQRATRERFNLADEKKAGIARSVGMAADQVMMDRHMEGLFFESLMDGAQQFATCGTRVPGVETQQRPLIFPCDDDYGQEGTVVLLPMDGRYGQGSAKFRVQLCLAKEDMDLVERHLIEGGGWEPASATSSSITYGAGKPFCPLGAPAKHCNGYRKPLYESLVERGNKVEFVGGTSAGDFEQTSCEGHRGKRIDEITENSLTGIHAAPNIVLLHAGTNDAKDQEADYPDAHDHLRNLISLVYEASADALVLLCTIIPADPAIYKGTASRIKDFNSKIPDVVDYFKSRDKKIRLVDMNQELTVDELSDGLHPNDEGYEIMAATFFRAIEDAEDDISKPTRGAEPPDSTSSSGSRIMPSEMLIGAITLGPKFFLDLLFS